MHGKGFILKRVYLERNQEREFKAHQKRLTEIKASSVGISGKIKPIDKQLKKSNQNHIKSSSFKEFERLREEKVTNQALITKLVDIQNGKFSVARKALNDQKASTMQQSKQGSLYVGSLNTIGRKQQEEKIARENHSLAQRMINLPPVIQKNKQDKEYQKSKQLKQRILRFHVLKEKPEKKYNRMQYDQFADEEDDDEWDPNDEKLMNQKVQMVIGLKDIQFINFLPQDDEKEKYFLEIKASVKSMRETIPETYKDFSQSVINEFFFLKELKKSKLVYVGLYQLKNGKKTFLGDFELDLTPYFQDDGYHDIHFDLRNYKELRTMPNYMHKDMRKKGSIDFYLQIHSKIKTFMLTHQPEKKQEQQEEIPVQAEN